MRNVLAWPCLESMESALRTGTHWRGLESKEKAVSGNSRLPNLDLICRGIGEACRWFQRPN